MVLISSHFLLDFRDFNKLLTLGYGQTSLTLRSLTCNFIVHEALVLVLHLFNSLINLKQYYVIPIAKNFATKNFAIY